MSNNVCGAGCSSYDDACFDRLAAGKEIGVAAHDPVCGKKLDCESEDVRQLNWEDATFFFCSTKCMTKFINDPKKYLGKRPFFRFLRRFF